MEDILTIESKGVTFKVSTDSKGFYFSQDLENITRHFKTENRAFRELEKEVVDFIRTLSP
jgi:hypothetical protein